MTSRTAAWIFVGAVCALVLYAITRKPAALSKSLPTARPVGKGAIGLLRGGPRVERLLPICVPQLHRALDGIPGSGLRPTIMIGNPNQPELELDPLTADRFYLRSIPEAVVVLGNVSETPWAGPDLQNLGVVA